MVHLWQEGLACEKVLQKSKKCTARSSHEPKIFVEVKGQQEKWTKP